MKLTGVLYPMPITAGVTVPVETHVVRRQDIDHRLGKDVLGLLSKAYTRQLEERRPYMARSARTRCILPPGTVSDRYRPSQENRIGLKVQRIRKDVAKGSTFVTLYEDEQLLGLAQLSRRHRKRDEDPQAINRNFIIIDEVLAAIPKKNIGSMVLHTALLALEARPGDRIVHDGYAGSDANAWFEQIGMSKVDERGLIRSVKLGKTELPLVRYAADIDARPIDVVERLEERRPWLMRGRMIAEPVDLY